MNFIQLTYQTPSPTMEHGAPPQKTLTFALPYHAIKYIELFEDEEWCKVELLEEFKPFMPPEFDPYYTTCRVKRSEIHLMNAR